MFFQSAKKPVEFFLSPCRVFMYILFHAIYNGEWPNHIFTHRSNGYFIFSLSLSHSLCLDSLFKIFLFSGAARNYSVRCPRKKREKAVRDYQKFFNILASWIIYLCVYAREGWAEGEDEERARERERVSIGAVLGWNRRNGLLKTL